MCAYVLLVHPNTKKEEASGLLLFGGNTGFNPPNGARMSVSGFSHRLKAESNWAPVDRIRYIRMEHAKKLLKQSAPRDAIRNTAWRLGFRSRQYFCTVFKQETGMTPGEFLRSGQ